MKQEKIIGITFAALGAALTVLCGILYLKADRTAPVIEFQTVDTIYKDGMDAAEILEGIEAYDSEEGDVTGRIVIEKIIEDREAGQAVVFYAVSDAAGNVAKASRVFEAVFDGTDEESGRAAEGFMEAGITAELGSLEKGGGGAEDGSSQENDGRTEGGAGQESRGGEESDGVRAASPSPAGTSASERENSPERQSVPAEESSSPGERIADREISAAPATASGVPDSVPVRETSPASEAGQAQGAASDGDSPAPTLSLKVSEVRVKAGQGPAWVDVIGTLRDDKDNYETLFRNLKVDKYDRDKPGTYQVGVRTEDSDGNSSGTVPLTIIVE